MKDINDVYAWHFLREDRRLGYDDDREVSVSEKLTVDVEPILCKKGLHGSPRAIDALRYAPGPIVCRVKLSGKMVRDDNKISAIERTTIAMADATTLLHTFACDVAEKALDKYGGDVDLRSRKAIEVKRKWLKGEARDDELHVARAAAWDAARAAAWAAEWETARAAAWAAAWDAVRAAEDAAGAAAGAAAWAAAGDAAWDEAREAAWDAARDVQNTAFEDMLFELLGINNADNTAA